MAFLLSVFVAVSLWAYNPAFVSEISGGAPCTRPRKLYSMSSKSFITQVFSM
jgi:hypothetical protein